MPLTGPDLGNGMQIQSLIRVFVAPMTNSSSLRFEETPKFPTPFTDFGLPEVSTYANPCRPIMVLLDEAESRQLFANGWPRDAEPLGGFGLVTASESNGLPV